MNEARNLEVILPLLPAVHEVILVDGRSIDDTVAIAQQMLPEIRILTQTRRGKGNALACGFRAATGDIVVMFDADGSADPAEIPRFVDALVAGADFAKGSRFCAGGGSEDITRFRRFGNFGLNTLANSIVKMRYTDLCYGYNAFWRDILGDLDLPSPDLVPINGRDMVWGDGFEIETVINCRIAAASLKIVEIPSFEKSRMHGVSNLNAVSDGFRVLKTIEAERRRARRSRVALATAAALATNGITVAEDMDAAADLLDISEVQCGLMVVSDINDTPTHETEHGLIVVTDISVEPARHGADVIVIENADHPDVDTHHGIDTHHHLLVVNDDEGYAEERTA